MAELIAAGAALGVASSMLTFTDVAWRVLKRVKDYVENTKDAPKVLGHIKAQLPILIAKVTKLKTDSKDGTLISPHSPLVEALKSCEAQMNDLDERIAKMLPGKDDLASRRAKKAVLSVMYEKEVSKSWSQLREYETAFIFHFTEMSVAIKELGDSLQINPIFSVPFDRDTKFIKRQDILANIDQQLKISDRVALAGIGGVGKSQLAIEYCYQFKDNYPDANVLWVHSSTTARFIQSYTDLARTLALPGWNDPKVDILQLVTDKINRDDRKWLVVFDNIDNPETFFFTSEVSRKLVIGYVPKSKNVLTIITTRDRRLGSDISKGIAPVMVPYLSEKEGKAMLLSKLPESNYDDVDMTKLVKVMEYLPLAITQAAGFITANSISLLEYLDIYNANDTEVKELLYEEQHDSRRDGEASSSVIRTWKISFDQIATQKPRAAEMLSLMANFDRQGISESLLQKEGESRVQFVTAIGTLQAFSLIATEKQGSSYEMHRLVQLSTQRWLEIQNSIHIWQDKALEQLSDKFPYGSYDNWTLCEALLPHVQLALKYPAKPEASQLKRACLLKNMGGYDIWQGKYAAAKMRLEEAKSIREKAFGENSVLTLEILESLAWVLSSLGDYEEAEKMSRQTLDAREKALGKDHPDTLAVALLPADAKKSISSHTL